MYVKCRKTDCVRSRRGWRADGPCHSIIKTGARRPILRHRPDRHHGQRRLSALGQCLDGPVLQRHPRGERVPIAHAHQRLPPRGAAPQHDKLGHARRRVHCRGGGTRDQAAPHRLCRAQDRPGRRAAQAGLFIPNEPDANEAGVR